MPLAGQEHAIFANYYPGRNRQIVNALMAMSGRESTRMGLIHSQTLNTSEGQPSGSHSFLERCLFLYGHPGSGISHLLQASCQNAQMVGRTAAYLPLSHPDITPEVLEDIHQIDLICLDDLNAVIGQPVWEEKLFYFYHLAMEGTASLMIGSHLPIKQLPWKLPDLASRLMSGILFSLTPLNDDEKIAALQLRAQQRGFDLSDEAGHYVITHFPRDLSLLFELLTQLDYASLAAKRKLTLPFIRQVLEKNRHRGIVYR